LVLKPFACGKRSGFMECTLIIKLFLKFNLKASLLILGKEAFKRYVRK
jgi:hypothetical protein